MQGWKLEWIYVNLLFIPTPPANDEPSARLASILVCTDACLVCSCMWQPKPGTDADLSEFERFLFKKFLYLRSFLISALSDCRNELDMANGILNCNQPFAATQTREAFTSRGFVGEWVSDLAFQQFDFGAMLPRQLEAQTSTWPYPRSPIKHQLCRASYLCSLFASFVPRKCGTWVRLARASR